MRISDWSSDVCSSDLHAIATQDWHPPDHLSFADQHPGKKPLDVIALPYGEQTLWPKHCLQGSHGAEIHNGIDAAKIELVIRKGFRRAIDRYSAFRRSEEHKSELQSLMRISYAVF